MTPVEPSSILLLLMALVLPLVALLRRRRIDAALGRLVLLWATIIALAWAVASNADSLRTYFT